MPKVTIIQGGKSVECEAQEGETIMDVAQSNGVNMLSACGGMGVCTTCMVEVKENSQNLSEVSESEQVMGFDQESQHRLGCQACVKGDVTVEIS